MPLLPCPVTGQALHHVPAPLHARAPAAAVTPPLLRTPGPCPRHHHSPCKPTMPTAPADLKNVTDYTGITEIFQNQLWNGAGGAFRTASGPGQGANAAEVPAGQWVGHGGRGWRGDRITFPPHPPSPPVDRWPDGNPSAHALFHNAPQLNLIGSMPMLDRIVRGLARRVLAPGCRASPLPGLASQSGSTPIVPAAQR